MTPRIALPVLALTALLAGAPSASAAAKPKPKSTPFDLVLKLGYTDSPSSVGTVVGVVSGKGISAGGFRVRLTASGDSATGPVAMYDGLGSIQGTLALRQGRGPNDEITLNGTLTVTGGTGRWAGAAGKLAFAGGLDSKAVPLVTVVRATAKGTITETPAAAPRAKRPRSQKVDISGDESKVDFDAAGPTLTTASLVGGVGPKPGILVWRKSIKAGDDIPAAFTLYTANGILRGAGTLSRSSSNQTRDVKVTGGTARFAQTRGTLSWSATSPTVTSGRFTTRLRGTLSY